MAYRLNRYGDSVAYDVDRANIVGRGAGYDLMHTHSNCQNLGRSCSL